MLHDTTTDSAILPPDALFGNRNLLARTIDFLALRLLLFVGFLIWFTLQTSDTTLGMILAAVGTGMVSVALALFKSIRLDRFIEEKRTELKYHYLFEQMVLMPKEQFFALLRELARSMGYETQLRWNRACCAKMERRRAFSLPCKSPLKIP